jgi:hypothetical protein
MDHISKSTFVPRQVLNTAVLFLVFNRLDTTKKVFEAIRQARPPRLYIAADGAREGRDGEDEKVNTIRGYVISHIDWDCEVKTLFREENLGCKYAVSGAITWFFENEEQGIILEDDCLPHNDFFHFCESMLARYADKNLVMAITGDNFQNSKKRGDASYYFSKHNHIWGWASWRRAWKVSDMEISFWPTWKSSAKWETFWPDVNVRKYWEGIFNKVYRSEIDTWDYSWTACIWYHGGLTITPNVNLVSNIGFGEEGTHTLEKNSPFACMPIASLDTITHPEKIESDNLADAYVSANLFSRGKKTLPEMMVFILSRILEKITQKIKVMR